MAPHSPRQLRALFAQVENSTPGDISLEDFSRQFQQWRGGQGATGSAGAAGATDAEASSSSSRARPEVPEPEPPTPAQQTTTAPSGCSTAPPLVVAVHLPKQGRSATQLQRLGQLLGQIIGSDTLRLDSVVRGTVAELHAQHVQPLVQSLLRGQSGHVVLHGAASTTTCALIRLAAAELFAAGGTAGLRLSYIQLHGERTCDLLANTAQERAQGKPEVGVVTSPRRRGKGDAEAWWPPNAATHGCADERSLLALLDRGSSRRERADDGSYVATCAARLSIAGRSGGALTFYELVQPSATDKPLSRRAVKERRGRDGRAVSAREQPEAKQRQGWLVLRRLLKRLGALDGSRAAEPSAAEPLPFRDSKLTLLLRPCLCPTRSSSVAVIGCCRAESEEEVAAARKTLQLCVAWRKATAHGARTTRRSPMRERPASPPKPRTSPRTSPRRRISHADVLQRYNHGSAAVAAPKAEPSATAIPVPRTASPRARQRGGSRPIASGAFSVRSVLKTSKASARPTPKATPGGGQTPARHVRWPSKVA